MFYWFAIMFLVTSAVMVLFALFLGFLESRNPTPPTDGTSSGNGAGALPPKA